MLPKKGKYVPCDNCGKIIYRTKAHYEPFKHQYCSRECTHKGQQKGDVIKCRICGRNFFRKYYLIKKFDNQYCSQKCYGESKKTGQTVKCFKCGATLYREKARIKRSELFYCSSCRADCSPKAIPKISLKLRNLWQTKEFREKTINGMHNPEHVAEMSKMRQEFWKNPEYVEKVKRNKLPNKRELQILSVLQSVSPDWIFVGDWKLYIDGKNPDFWNHRFGLIEYFGDYWHKNDDPQERIDLFKKFGFDTMVLNDGDVKNKQLLREKIAEFHNGIAKEEKL